MMESFKSKLYNFMELTRAYSLGMTLASCLVIFSYAQFSEKFSFLNFILLVLAISFVHMGANLFDDYSDVKAKLKLGIKFEEMKFANERKAITIRNGCYTIRQVEIILLLLFSLSLAIGAYFAFITSWKVLLFALIGGLLTLFYPVSSKYYCAEIIIGLLFGPLAIMGGYYALIGAIEPNLFIMSWAICITTIILLHVHNIMDWEFDVKEGKNTLAILSKSKQNAIFLLKCMIFASYAIVFLGVITLKFNPHTCYVFLTLPIASRLIESINDYINIRDVKFIPRWYYGPFENWEKIKEKKSDFFMYRFYLARNFSFFFAVFASIGTMD